MTTRHSVAVGVLALLLALPIAWSQGTVSVTGLVLDELGARAVDATVRLELGGQFQETRTNATGHFNVSGLAPADYRLQVLVPDASGELWHDATWALKSPSTFDAPIVVNRTMPFLPRAPILGNVTPSNPPALARSATLGVSIPVRLAADATANVTIRVTVRVDAGAATQENFTLGPIEVSPGRQAWANASLTPTASAPFHAQEGTHSLRVELFVNATGRLLDQSAPVTFRVAGTCTGDSIVTTLTVAGRTFTTCAPPGQVTTWNEWAANATRFQAASAAWENASAANASGWSAQAALDAWGAYLGAMGPMRAAALDRLDASQTDAAAQPNWTTLQSMRTHLLAAESRLTDRIYGALDDEASGRTAQTARSSWTWSAALLGGALAGAAAGLPAARAMSLRWKRQVEYWIGYTSKSEPRAPLGLYAAVAGALLVAGAAAFLALGGLGILGGGP